MDYVKDIFTQEYIEMLNALKLNISKNLTGSFAGNRRSRAKGSSIDFSDFRNYTLGDDIRRIDWNSYGRLDKLYVKVFEEERQSHVNIFLDISKSMDFGEKNKLFFGKVIAASIAYMAISKSDNVNIFTFHKKLELNIKNASTKNKLASIIEFLDSLEASEETDMEEAFSLSDKYGIRPGMGIFISDFLTKGDYKKVLLNLLYKKQKVSVLHVLSQEELMPDISGGIRLVDSENDAKLDIEIDTVVMEEYKKELTAFIEETEQFCKSRGIDYSLISSQEPYNKYLNKLR